MKFSHILNLVISITISIALYVLHIWAAGDSKFFITVTSLIAIDISVYEGRYIYSGITIPAFAFSLSFIYLLIESLVLTMKNKVRFSKAKIKKQLITFMSQYLTNIVYITFIIKIEKILVPQYLEEYGIEIAVINLCIILMIANTKILKQRYLVIFVLLCSLILSIVSKVWIINMTRIGYYTFTIFLMIIKMLISEFNYRAVRTDDVKKGMIPSALTTILFAQSRIKGLPQMSYEDMRSRITQEEAEAIKKWGRSKNGLDEIQIVKKVPFAIFISFGVLGHVVLWGILH